MAETPEDTIKRMTQEEITISRKLRLARTEHNKLGRDIEHMERRLTELAAFNEGVGVGCAYATPVDPLEA